MQQKKTTLAIAVLAACGGYASTGVAQVAGPNASDVEELIVFGTQGARDSTTGSRLDLTLLETPATVDIIDGDAIRARVDTSVLEAVTRSAGFTNESNPGVGGFSVAARGFNGQNAVTKLYDGTEYYNAASTITFPFDTWSIERIEVLKGPSSVLFGQGGIGGAINVIPRKPERDGSGAVRVLAGEDSTTFLGIDFTGPLGDTLSYRIDYSNSQSDNWVFNGDSEAEMLAASLRWDVSDDLALSVRLDMGEQSPMVYFGVPVAQRDGFYGDFVDGTFNGDFIENFAGVELQRRRRRPPLRRRLDSPRGRLEHLRHGEPAGRPLPADGRSLLAQCRDLFLRGAEPARTRRPAGARS